MILQQGVVGRRELRSCGDTILQQGVVGRRELRSCGDTILQQGVVGRRELRSCGDTILQQGVVSYMPNNSYIYIFKFTMRRTYSTVGLFCS